MEAMRFTARYSANLIEMLRLSQWSSCIPDGENFDAIAVGNPADKDDLAVCLSRPADRYCPYGVTFMIMNPATRESFEVSGFVCGTFLHAISLLRDKPQFLSLAGQRSQDDLSATEFEIAISRT